MKNFVPTQRSCTEFLKDEDYGYRGIETSYHQSRTIVTNQGQTYDQATKGQHIQIHTVNEEDSESGA